MSNLITVGVVIALLGLVVWLARHWGADEMEKEIEKATSRESQKVALDKLEAVENAALQIEANTREKEHQEIEHENAMPEGYHRTNIGFYPTRLHPKDPNDLN